MRIPETARLRINCPSWFLNARRAIVPLSPKIYGMAKRRTSIATEIGWLAYFLVVFVAAVYLLVRTLVPHHFNDKIAIALAAIFAGLIMIGTRAWISRWQHD
jgi:hypothetical protein